MSVIKPALQHPDQIAYFLGANNYCWLHFRNGEKKLLAKPISYLESKLPDFIRVHKTALINPSYIKSLQEPPRRKMAGTVCLDNGELFPVSRRRWTQVVESLQNHTDLCNGSGVKRVLVGSSVSDSNQVAESAGNPSYSILLITDDEQNAVLTEEIVKKRWPDCQFNMRLKSAILPDLLKQLPEQEHPILILLDARTTTMERLRTLQRLKEDIQLKHIPIVLLALPTDQTVTYGYQQKANSVITMPTGYRLFSQIIERICQFWLNTVILPKAVR